MSKTPELDAEITRNKQRDAQEKNGIAREEATQNAKGRAIEREDNNGRFLRGEADRLGSVERGRRDQVGADHRRSTGGRGRGGR